MSNAPFKGFITLIPLCALFAGTVVIWLRSRSISAMLQFLGATSLLVVVLIHVFEGLRIFPWMGWGLKNSIGHYLDMLCAILGFTLFSVGYLIHTVKMRVKKKEDRERV
jgi:formate hydrogenlyase subunit 3/multisubunit Na+/H+ antiporter MnhD subunit